MTRVPKIVIPVTSKYKFRGFFRLQTVNEYGKVTKDTGFFPNLITNGGLDYIGYPQPSSGWSSFFLYSCCIGTGNTTPAYTDTTLQAGLAAAVYNSTLFLSNTSYNAGPPAYWQGQKSWQFAAGTATGNIAEIGISPYSSASGYTGANLPLYSRALVVDGGGSPTVIPVLASEALTVTYILQVYIDETSHPYTMSLSGTSYSGSWQVANVTTVPPLGVAIGSSLNSDTAIPYHGGTIGPITGAPTGTGIGIVNAVITPYTLGTYYSTRTYTWDINHGNGGGIDFFLFQLANSAGQFQMSVTPTIPKTNVYNLSIVHNTSWARYP